MSSAAAVSPPTVVPPIYKPPALSDIPQEAKALAVQTQAGRFQASLVDTYVNAASSSSTNDQTNAGSSPSSYSDSLARSSHVVAKQVALATAGIGINVSAAA